MRVRRATVVGRPAPGFVLLAGLAVGAGLWAHQTYGLGPARSLPRLHRVLFWAPVPALVVATLERRPRPGATSRRLLESLVAPLVPFLVLTGLLLLLVRPDGVVPDLTGTATFLVAAAYGWLVASGLGAAVLHRPLPAVPTTQTATPSSRSWPLLGAELVGGVCAVAIGLTMPLTTRGLIEPERIGMADQVLALVTGYADPAPARLVGGYLVLLLLMLAAGHLVRHRPPRTFPH